MLTHSSTVPFSKRIENQILFRVDPATGNYKPRKGPTQTNPPERWYVSLAQANLQNHFQLY